MGGGSSMPVMQQTSKPQSAAAQADHGRNQVALSAVASPTQEPVSLIQKSRGSPAPTPAWARTEKEEKNVGPAISKSSALYEVTSSPALNWMDKPVDTLIEDALKGSRTRPTPFAARCDIKPVREEAQVSTHCDIKPLLEETRLSPTDAAKPKKANKMKEASHAVLPRWPPASEADHKTKAPLATTEESTLFSGFLR